MSKLAVIYWTGTGNTGAMAQAVADGAKSAGVEAELLTVSEISADAAAAYDKLALGCPAMGAEVLEEGEFEPFFTALEGRLAGRKVALFGSYGWGDGQWMREWQERTEKAGAVICAEGLIVNEAPDEAGLESCRALGMRLASA